MSLQVLIWGLLYDDEAFPRSVSECIFLLTGFQFDNVLFLSGMPFWFSPLCFSGFLCDFFLFLFNFLCDFFLFLFLISLVISFCCDFYDLHMVSYENFPDAVCYVFVFLIPVMFFHGSYTGTIPVPPNPLCPSPRGGLYRRHYASCRARASRQKNFLNDNACSEIFFDPLKRRGQPWLAPPSWQSQKQREMQTIHPQPRRGFGFTRRQIQEKYTCMPRPGGVFPASFPALIERSLCFSLHRIPCAKVAPPDRSVKGRKIFSFEDDR